MWKPFLPNYRKKCWEKGPKKIYHVRSLIDKIDPARAELLQLYVLITIRICGKTGSRLKCLNFKKEKKKSHLTIVSNC